MKTQIKESNKEINGFTLEKNTEDMAILKVAVKTPLEIAMHPYLSSNYEYITITKGCNHVFTIVKEDGTTFSFHYGFSGCTSISEELIVLRNKVNDTLEEYGVIIDVQTMGLPYKMDIFYDTYGRSWQATLSFQDSLERQSIWSSKAKNEEEMCKEIEEKFKIKFNPLIKGRYQTGIDFWGTERDYSHE